MHYKKNTLCDDTTRCDDLLRRMTAEPMTPKVMTNFV